MGAPTSTAYTVVDASYPTNGDFATLYEALDAGATHILVRAGTYNLTQQIVIPANTTIIGENFGGVVFDADNDVHNFALNGFNILIENIKVLDCRNGIGTFRFNSVENCVVRNCSLDFCNRAAYFMNSTYCTLENCEIRRMTHHSVVVDVTSSDIRVLNNRIRNGSSYGIYVQGNLNKVLHNSVYGHAANDGVFVSGNYNTIGHNICDSNQNGIYVGLTDGDQNILIGNVCRGNNGFGLHINAVTVNRLNLIIGNVLLENGIADLSPKSATNLELGNIVGTLAD